MTSLPAYQYELSIAITIYSIWYDQPQTTRCEFHLRNLRSDAQEELIKRAQQVMCQVVDEIHYLTGFGIDKSLLKIGSTKVDEVVHSDLKPCMENVRFKALLFQFSPVYRYEWVINDRKKRLISETEIEEGWQPQAVPSSHRRTESFRLPAIVNRHHQQAADGYQSFFRHAGNLTKKRKRTPYGFNVAYDRNDQVFQRFIDRFSEEGNLAFSKKGFFAGPSTRVDITGRDWPKSKAKAEKYPRKSVLASRPTDDTDYVYIIRAGRTNLYKIGISNDPQGRLDSLQTANPYKLKLIHVFKADNAAAAEEELHRLLHNNRMEGEWFKLTPAEKDVLLSIENFENRSFLVGNKQVNADSLFR